VAFLPILIYIISGCSDEKKSEQIEFDKYDAIILKCTSEWRNASSLEAERSVLQEGIDYAYKYISSKYQRVRFRAHHELPFYYSLLAFINYKQGDYQAMLGYFFNHIYASKQLYAAMTEMNYMFESPKYDEAYFKKEIDGLIKYRLHSNKSCGNEWSEADTDRIIEMLKSNGIINANASSSPASGSGK
jgi:hypothetical protein